MDDNDADVDSGAAVPSEYYLGGDYDTVDRFISYWHQIKEIASVEADGILDIGIGNGFLCNYLRQRGIEVLTMDVNSCLRPNVVGTITSLPFMNESFGIVTAFEVLEHIPQEDVMVAMREMRRVTQDVAIVSVPNMTPTYGLQLELPRIGQRRWLIERSVVSTSPPGGQHMWEIGRGGMSVEDFREWVREAGFEIRRDYRPFQCPDHHFFVLSK